MSSPEFEHPDKNYEFTKGEEIYVIDKNKVDIWKAVIRRIGSNGFGVHYESSQEDKKYPTAQRFLLRTEKNNAIFEEQDEERSKVEGSLEKAKKVKKEKAKKEKVKKEKKTESKSEKKKTKKNQDKPKTKPKANKKKIEDDDEEENDDFIEDDDDDEEIDIDDDESEDSQTADEDPSNDYDTGSQSNSEPQTRKRKRGTPSNKPIIDIHFVVNKAWQNGMQTLEAFDAFIQENLQTAKGEFEKLYRMMNVNDGEPPFVIGGTQNPQEVAKFWKGCQVLWKETFGETESIPLKDFLKKAASLFKLPNQKESNAREALQFFFDPETYKYIDFVQFSAFLAMFGPQKDTMRKISQWFKCPVEMKNSLIFPDIPDNSLSLDSSAEMNRFVLALGENKNEEGENEAEASNENESEAPKENESEASKEQYVYNIPFVDAEENYLIDGEGKSYKDWTDYFEKNNPNPETNQEQKDNQEEN